MQQRAKTIKKTSTPKLLIFSTISCAFDFPLLLVPLNRIRMPNNFLNNYGILGDYSFAVLETFFFFWFPKQQILFLPCSRALGNQFKKHKLKETKKLKIEIWKRLEVVFQNTFVFSGK
jgi:hypothetical protein